MDTHEPPTIDRHTDVAVIGGSAAGLAAALQLGRQRRSVVVVDAGEPRNAPAAHMHGYLGHEGLPPAELAALGREEVRSYGGEIVAGRALDVSRTDDGRFRVRLTGGHGIVARRVLAATGLVDELPDVDGVARHWGGDVVHCPFCHGYEVRDRRIVQLLTHPMGLHPAALFRQLSEHLTIVVHDGITVDAAELDTFRAAGVRVVAGPARRLVEDGGRVVAVELADGERVDADAVAVTPSFRARAEAFTSLGLTLTAHPSGLGEIVETGPTGETSVPGLYAAGNVTDPSQQVLHAAAAGSRAGAMISFSLADEDLRSAARPSAVEADWDHRYGGDRVWSGNPNGTLVHEVADLPAGRALDVGAGEGGDAVWLAEQGWTVTANDISTRALGHIAAEARRRGLSIECRRADANGVGAFGDDAFDLVSAQYASIPRTPDDRALHNLLDAVAPGGTLVAVSHDVAPMRAPIDTHEHSRPFDADAYLRVEEIAAAVAADPGWEVVVHEARPRPPGAASAAHHVDDVVLRARRVTA